MGQKMHPHGLRVGVIKDWNSKGSAVRIRKRTSHITIVLKERV